MPTKKQKMKQAPLAHTVDSVIVHDMKNLAFRLSALLQNMEDNYENPIFKQSVLEILGDTIRKMNTIVKRFRDHQQQVIVKLRVDVNRILKELLEGIPSKATRNCIIETDFTEVPQIWGDPYYLHNAFLSLIENGLDAMPTGGILRVVTRLKRRGKKKKIIVEVSDSGVGMSPSFVENQLFTPFASTKEQGLGLGLYTSQQILALHRGTIQVDSAPDAGTTFLITLPVEDDVA